MSALRYYYSDSISGFLTKNTEEIIGKLTLASQHDINDDTSNSWVEEIETLKSVLTPYKERGSVYFEYNIPRMGRRADVILVIDELVFVLEFKTSGSKFTHDAITQVWDYALDLKNFQEGSLERVICSLLEKTSTDKRSKPSLPLWLSPTQVRIIPVTDNHLEYAEKVLQEVALLHLPHEAVLNDPRTTQSGRRERSHKTDRLPNCADSHLNL